MIWLDAADLAVIAGRALGMDTRAALGMLDIAAAGAALAEAQRGEGQPGRDGGDCAAAAAGLLRALIRHHPFRSGNQQVAFVAMVQFLALNGWQADLDPPEAAQAVIADLASGALTAADAAAWLSPRLIRFRRREAPTKETRMQRWLPGRGRRPTFHRFTDRARRVVVLAQDEARMLDHNYIGTEHILLGLLAEGEGVAAKSLQKLGISLEAVRQQVEQIIGQGQQEPARHIPMTPRAKKVLELSLREALRLGHNYIGTEHILLGLIREGEGVAAQVLTRLGAEHDRVRAAILQALASHQPGRGEPAPPPVLRDYDEKIAAARQQKDAALDAGDLDRAAALREEERRLLDERARRLEEWSSGADAAALGEEVERLRHEVARLRDLLRHDTQPGEGHQETA
jgi:prophage maintenance system killer protein